MSMYIKGIKRIYDYNRKLLSFRFNIFLNSSLQEQCFNKYIYNIWVVVKNTDISTKDRFEIDEYLETYGLIYLTFIDDVDRLLEQNKPPLKHDRFPSVDLLVIGFTKEEINKLMKGVEELYKKYDIEIKGPIDIEKCNLFYKRRDMLKIYKTDIIRIKE